MIGAEGERVFLAEIATILVDHREAIGVGVLAEANGGAHLDDMPEHAGQVLGDWLRQVFELAVWRRAKNCDTATQRFE